MNNIPLIGFVALLCISHITWVARRRAGLALAMAFTLGVSFLFIALSLPFHDEYKYFPDQVYYLYLIEHIAQNPADWNPLTGLGPSDELAMKIGYSYVVGLLVFVFGADPLLAALAFNLIMSIWLSVAVYHLSFLLSGSTGASITAAIISALYPEILIWRATVLRENVTLLLLTVLIYAVIRLNVTARLKYVFLAIGMTLALSLARAQLAFMAIVLVVLSVPFYYLRLSERIWSRRRMVGLVTLGILSLSLAVIWPYLQMRIFRVTGYQTLQDLPLTPHIWYPVVTDALFWNTVLDVLSPIARGEQQIPGFLLAFVVVPMWSLIFFSATRFKAIFREQMRNALFVLMFVLVFLMGLAYIGRPDIRFRSNIAPTLVAYLGPVIWYVLCRISKIFKDGPITHRGSMSCVGGSRGLP